MGAPGFFFEPRVPRLATLLKEVKDGQILVPRFQRPFVWTLEQRINLLESIYRRYPIGSLLVWRTQEHQLRSRPELGLFPIPKDDGQPRVRQYLLDGHQRVTTLFNALGPGLYEELDRQSVYGGVDEWPMYFDLLATDSNPFCVRGSAGEIPQTWLPLDLLFDSFALGEYRDKLRAQGLGRDVVNRAQELADIFRDYSIPVVPIVTEDIAHVTTTFKRVNSAGLAMSEVHMIHALTWDSNFDLEEMLEGVDGRLADEGWGGVDHQDVLDLCKHLLKLDPYRCSPETLSQKLKQTPDVVETATRGLLEAARLLRDNVGVLGPKAMPYGVQLTVLASVLLLDLPRTRTGVERGLPRWFWQTTLGDDFVRRSAVNFAESQRRLAEMLAGSVAEKLSEADVGVLPVRRFDIREPRARGVALLMANHHDSVQGGDSSRRSLAELGAEAIRQFPPWDSRSESVENGGPERYIICSREGWATVMSNLSGKSRERRVLDAHLISVEAAKAWRLGVYGQFYKLRREAIMDLERRAADGAGMTILTPPQRRVVELGPRR